MSQLDGADGRAPASADFLGRMSSPRRRPPFVVLGWVAVLGVIVALGLSGRPGGSGDGSVSSNAGAVNATAGGPSGRVDRSSFRVIAPGEFASFPPLVTQTSAPGPISLRASRQPSTVFVHGDVFAQQVTSVYVSLQSLDGQIGGWVSVIIPGAAGESRDHRPAVRFDVELAIPTGFETRVLIVRANAYNAEQGLVASTNVRLEAQM